MQTYLGIELGSTRIFLSRILSLFLSYFLSFHRTESRWWGTLFPLPVIQESSIAQFIAGAVSGILLAICQDRQPTGIYLHILRPSSPVKDVQQSEEQ